MTVLQYAATFESYLDQLGEYDESYFLTHFIFGLRPEIMREVHIRQPESLRIAKNIAETIELTHQATSGWHIHTHGKRTAKQRKAQHRGTQERQSDTRQQSDHRTQKRTHQFRDRNSNTYSFEEGCKSAHSGALEVSCPERHGPAAVWRSMLRDLPQGDRAGRVRR